MNEITDVVDVTQQLKSVSGIEDRLDGEQYIEYVRKMILLAHKHPDNSKVELRLVRDPKAVEEEQIFANRQQTLEQQKIQDQQKTFATQQQERRASQFRQPQASKQYESKEKLIHNSKIVFTCNCGKSFAFGSAGHDDHKSDSFGVQPYDDTKEGKFSKINEYGLLVEAEKLAEVVSFDYSSELPKKHFSTGYDKQEDNNTSY